MLAENIGAEINIDNPEGIDFIKSHESEIDSATEKVANENRTLIPDFINKGLGYIGERTEEIETKLLALDLKAGDYLKEVSKPSNIARPVTTAALLYALATGSSACTTLPASSFIAVPEGQPAATEVMENNEGDTQKYEAIPTEQITPTSTQEEQGISEEEKERILSEYNNTLTYEEIEILRGKGGLQKAINTQRSNLGNPVFLQYFTNNFDHWGLFYNDLPYSVLYGSLNKDKSMSEFFDEVVVDEMLFNMMIDSHNRQFFDRTKPPEESHLWEEGEKITMVFYVYKDSDEFGEFTIPWSDNGGVYIIKPDIYANPPYKVSWMSPEDIRNGEWTDDELRALDQKAMILDYTLKKGEVIGRGNYEKVRQEHGLVNIEEISPAGTKEVPEN